jgi:hypothetical protein
MATRATYGFTKEDGSVQVFYVHHDGYPSGAGDKLRGCTTAESFQKWNDRAELVESHDAHSDTEYRYNVRADGETMTAFARTSWSASGEAAWSEIYCGDMVKFCSVECKKM